MLLPSAGPTLHPPGLTVISMNGLSTSASMSPPGKNWTEMSTSTLLGYPIVRIGVTSEEETGRDIFLGIPLSRKTAKP